MIKNAFFFGLILMVMSLIGCTLIRPQMEPPSIVLESLQMLPSNGLNQRFNIGLRMTNPNDRPLTIKGINYNLALNGYDLINGVGNNIPEVAAFSEVVFNVQASTNMFEVLRFINDFLGGQAQGDLDYELRADISVAGWMKKISVEKSGKVPLLAAEKE